MLVCKSDYYVSWVFITGVCYRMRECVKIGVTAAYSADFSVSGNGIIFSEEYVAAGFPSPAEGYTGGHLNLDEHLIKHPSATFFVRAAGESMTGVGIFPGDLLIVDRSLRAVDGSVVIAVVDG